MDEQQARHEITIKVVYDFPVLIEYDPEEEVYLADCPALPGCYTDGKTYEEALANIQDAIRLCIESRLAVGDPIPVPQAIHVGGEA
ncbi:MAG: type II toxin-antitoxin system HicB family antitoxin [Chloroflexi bacterium]|nr:MAG: type II toxin-antitoxin system HicB family antitoxin [Chloroflexota bacterium]